MPPETPGAVTVPDFNLTVVLTGVGTFLTTAAGAWVLIRKARSDQRQADVKTRGDEIAVDAKEARERQKIRQDDEAWAVKQARALYQEMRDRMDALVENERLCQIRLATIETQYADLKLQHEEVKARLARLEGDHHV